MRLMTRRWERQGRKLELERRPATVQHLAIGFWLSKWRGVCNDQVMMMMIRFWLEWVWQSLWLVTVVVKGSHVGSSHNHCTG